MTLLDSVSMTGHTFEWRILRVGALRDCLDAWAQDALYTELPELVRASSELIIDEMGSNFLRHSGSKAKEMLLTIRCEDDILIMTFNDDGLPFDPGTIPTPPVANIGLLPVGGRGLHMVRQSVDSWEYVLDGKRNINTFRKAIRPATTEAETEAV